MRGTSRCILLAAAALLLVCATAAHSAYDRPLIFGMNPMPAEWSGHDGDQSWWEPEQYAKMKQAGCTAVRYGIGWDLIEPTRGVRNWGDIDNDIKLFLDHGFEPVLLIVATPAWALLPGQGTPFYPPQLQFRADFEKFVYDCARRFRGRVKYYEFWNEPNGWGWNRDPNGNTYQKAWEYVPWLIHGYNSIKKGDPNALWAIGGLDDNGVGYADDYLAKCYRYMSKGYFDAVCEHPYSSSNAELWKLDDLRAVMANYGDALPIWITELGWPANGRESQVATWITDYLTRLSSDDYSYCKMATYHTATDFTAEPHGYGLMTYDLGTQKPTYQAFKSFAGKPARASVTGTPTVTLIGPARVRVSFTSDMPATAQIMYGLTTAYGMVTARATTPSTSHTFYIDGLLPNTIYNYRVRLGAGEYADDFSQNLTFRTAIGSVVSLVGPVRITNVGTDRATVTWTTNLASTSRIDYGEDCSYPYSVSDAALVTEHSITVTGLHSHRAYQARVVSTKSGYGNLSVETEPIVTRRVAGLISNGGFESYGPKQPWVIYGRNDGRVTGTWYWGLTARTGSAFFGSAGNWDGKTGGCYQQIGAVPGQDYWVSAYTRSVQVGGPAGADAARLGIDPTGGADPYASTVQWGFWTYSQSGWARMDCAATAQSDEITIFVDIRQPATYEWNVNIVDDVDLHGVNRFVSLGEVKSAVPGEPVASIGAVCTANFGDHLYVQSPDRTGAVRINYSNGAAPGDMVAFEGRVGFAGPEKCVIADAVGVTGRGAEPQPVAMLLRSVGGAPLPGQAEVIPGQSGQNTLGSLVKVCGTVTASEIGHYYLDDGSARVKVVLPEQTYGPLVGFIVSTWGIAGTQNVNGQWAPVIKMRGSSDFTLHYPQ